MHTPACCGEQMMKHWPNISNFRSKSSHATASVCFCRLIQTDSWKRQHCFLALRYLQIQVVAQHELHCPASVPRLAASYKIFLPKQIIVFSVKFYLKSSSDWSLINKIKKLTKIFVNANLLSLICIKRNPFLHQLLLFTFIKESVIKAGIYKTILYFLS